MNSFPPAGPLQYSLYDHGIIVEVYLEQVVLRAVCWMSIAVYDLCGYHEISILCILLRL